MLDLSQIQLIKLQKHQLNNQGCRCQMCQKIVSQQTMKIVIQKVYDHESQAYGESTKEFYIKIINKMADWEQKSRKLRFLLPEICVYQNLQPIQLIIKKTQNMHIKIIRDKSKMHMFEIIQFFLQGFVHHNPEPAKKTHKRKATSFFVGNYTEKYKNECILVAKYRNNFYNMLTLTQIQSLFKSRYKYMRDGLLYLQTLVCTKNYTETRVNLIVRDIMKTEIYDRAKNQIKIFHGEIKGSDLEYVTQEEEIKFENQLKQKNMRSYLQYLSLKIVLAFSRTQSTIISESVFKYVHSKGLCYLIDVRITKVESNEEFWATAALKAFQFRLSRRMSMMDVGSSNHPQSSRYLSRKAQNLSYFLQKSTQSQFDQMKMIKTRLQRLQKQKKSLLQSQSAIQNKSQLSMNKSFKIRSMQKH